ncbi:hypothetical protein ASPBRDRAFT_531003 [Aspergillus brasiliensis CBS 101740]|uniref:Uncharacterized protein n=1 Tax=Aspergillus brasiliensis (strain CBS 101740 / IMI 381727 / IBT 21946) TaxID=767769 RepID=A0A1L9UR80_ASPBC|nr:hypothetical protein ASPBRDRAFT_531003 [Aspergillus brasiliensis CBS 101740]
MLDLSVNQRRGQKHGKLARGQAGNQGEVVDENSGRSEKNMNYTYILTFYNRGNEVSTVREELGGRGGFGERDFVRNEEIVSRGDQEREGERRGKVKGCEGYRDAGSPAQFEWFSCVRGRNGNELVFTYSTGLIQGRVTFHLLEFGGGCVMSSIREGAGLEGENNGGGSL